MGLETEQNILDESKDEKNLGVYTNPKLNSSSHHQKFAT